MKRSRGITSLLSKIIEVSNSTLIIERRLVKITRLIKAFFKANLTGVFELNSEKGVFILRALSSRICKPVRIIEIPAGDGVLSQSVLKKEMFIEKNFSFKIDKHLSSLEEFSSLTENSQYISIPISDGDFLFGALFLILPAENLIFPEEIELLNVIAKEIAGTIRNAKLYYNAKKRVNDLATLYEIAKVSSSTLELYEYLDIILKTTVNTFKAKGGEICLVSERTSKIEAFLYYDSSVSPHTFCPYPFSSEKCISEKETTSSTEVVVPLIHKDKKIGAISLFGLEDEWLEGKKTKKVDHNILEAIALQIASTIVNATTYKRVEGLSQELEKKVEELSLINQLNSVLLTTIESEKLYYTILTALTFGGGLGFNRAMLFIVSEDGKDLKGVQGVGPESGEEAGRIWKNFENSKSTLMELVNSEEMIKLQEKSKFNEKAKMISIPLNQHECVIVKTFKEKKVYNAKEFQCKEHGSGNISCLSHSHPFASVPIIAKGIVIGVITVDNLYNKKPITPDDLSLLSFVANNAALSIENSNLYSSIESAYNDLKNAQMQLLHKEKLAALGEMAAKVSHEIRNPLVSIGGFARILSTLVKENSQERRYTDIISSEVKRLERILNDILSFASVKVERFKKTNITEIIKDSVNLISEELKKLAITVRFENPDIPVVIQADPPQIKQVVVNLLENAIQAMNCIRGGEIQVSCGIEEDANKVFISVTDNGGGIPTDILSNIFNPFFTTKELGTGLGLAICHTIVSHHKGEIHVFNIPEKGATFKVLLPLVQERGHGYAKKNTHS